MRLLHPEEMPEPFQGLVCRQSRFATLLGAVVMLAMIIGIPTLLWQNAHVWWWVTLIAATLAGLILKLILGNAWRSLLTSNWLLRMGPDCLWINIRWFANCDFAPARTVIEVPYLEIKNVGEHVQKRFEYKADSDVRWTDRYLDIRCLQPVPGEISVEVADERRRNTSGTALRGLVTYSSRTDHQSVTIPAADVIRLAWRGKFDWVTPSLNRTLRELQGRVTVVDKVHTDYSNLEKLTPEELDQLILQLVESDDRVGAIKLLETRRGYSMTEANKFVAQVVASL